MMDLEDWLMVGLMFLVVTVLIGTFVYLFQLAGY